MSRRISLASRLTLLFSVATVSIYSVAGVHLYHSLSEQLRFQDDSALVNTVNLLRHQLELYENVDALRNDPHRLLDVFLGRQGMLLAVYGAGGSLIVANAGGDILLPSSPPISDDLRPGPSDIKNWRLNDNLRSRMISAWGKVGKIHGERVQIAVAYDGSESAAVLEEHWRHVLWAMATGVLATLILGYFLVRGGLQPLRAVAQAAGQITASRLGGRLRVENAPAELSEMVLAFNEMLSRLEGSFERLTQFSSDIAHDLRTPINNLMIETQVTLRNPRQTSEYEALLTSNIEEYERLNRMIESMLFLARADNAQISLSRQAISLNQELRHIAEYFSGMAEERHLHIDAGGEGTIMADQVLLRRAISNLVMNAIQHSPRGGEIALRSSEQLVGKVVISVTNSGVGIPGDLLPRIFDRFYRADSARSGSHSSSGLGLAIVKSIASLHGGDVRVESAQGGLTTFYLELPKTAGLVEKVS